MEKKKLSLKKEVIQTLSNTSQIAGGYIGKDTFHSNCLCIEKTDKCPSVLPPLTDVGCNPEYSVHYVTCIIPETEYSCDCYPKESIDICIKTL